MSMERIKSQPLADLLRRYRSAAGLTQEELAADLTSAFPARIEESANSRKARMVNTASKPREFAKSRDSCKLWKLSCLLRRWCSGASRYASAGGRV